jgi:hypothetical protein
LGSARPGAADEERDGVPFGERLHRELDLAADAEPLSARRDDRQVRAGLDEVGERGRGTEDLLEVVEDEEHLALADVIGEEVGGAEGLRDLPGDQRRVADRRELDPECPRLLIGYELGGRLDREPGLAAAARPREGDEPSPVTDQGHELVYLLLAANEGARRPRKVRVGDRIEWREALGAELQDPRGTIDVLEPMFAEVGERVGVECGGDARRVREEHLAAVAGGADPCAEVHIVADIPLGRAVRRAGMDPDTNVDLARTKSLAAFIGRTDGIERIRERVEERVALGVDLDTTVPPECIPEEPTVFGERVRILLSAQPMEQLGRPLDVGEDEGDLATWKVTRHRGHHGRTRVLGNARSSRWTGSDLALVRDAVSRRAQPTRLTPLAATTPYPAHLAPPHVLGASAADTSEIDGKRDAEWS